MRRARDSRLLRALVGLWFAVALSEPAALHACAMHGAQHHPASSALQGHAANANAANAHAAPHASRRGPVQHAQHAGCSCLGSCCAAAAAVLPVPAVAAASSTTVRPARAVLHRATAFRLAEPAYARPPSHAPPRTPA